MASRQYSSALRADQARLSKERIAAAAAALFVEKGYAATTIGAVAERAGVSLQTVYNAVGGKPALLTIAYMNAILGEADSGPIAESDEYRAMMASADAAEALRRYCGISRGIHERAGRITNVILGETGTPEVVDLARDLESQRLNGARDVVAMIDERWSLRPGLSVENAAARLWTLNGPESADRLVNQRGWSWDDYEEWMADTCIRTLLD